MKSSSENENRGSKAAFALRIAVNKTGLKDKRPKAQAALVLGLILQVCMAAAQNLATNPGFETGNATGWFAFGPTAVSVQTNQVHSGSYAALVTNRTATWMGIAQAFQGVLQTNQPYIISAWVRLAGGPNQTMQLTLQKIDDSGTTYTPIASSSVSANDWTYISGEYTLNYSGTLATLNFYAEMPSSPDAAYYIDEVEIEPIVPPVVEENTNSFSGQHFIFSSMPTVGNTPTAVVAADLNGDHVPELIVANYFGNSLTVLAKGEDGAFATFATVFMEGNPYSIVAVDLNGDGRLDVATATDSGNTVTVLTNSGNGTLVLATNLAPGNRPLSVKAADVNGDGRPDLISANHGDGTLTVFTNDGNGGFSLAVTLMARGPFVVADFNGDGAQDLIATGSAFVGLTVFTNDGSGAFAESSPLMLPSQLPLGYLAAADLNGDGKPDVITVEDSGTTAGGSLTIMTNNGDGTFTLAPSPAGYWSPASMGVADVNEDGWQDLIGFNQAGLNVLVNDGKGTFNLSAVASVAYRPVSVFAADVVGNSSPDLIFVNSGANSLTILRSVPPSPTTTPHSYVFSIGEGLSPALQGPRGVTVDGNGNLYVADTGNHRIVKFSRTGDFLLQWGAEGSALGQFVDPCSIAIDSADNVYVADSGNDWIQKFASNGTYLTGWQCPHPTAVTVDRHGQVYVADRGVESWVFNPWGLDWSVEYVAGVRKFTGNGTLLQAIPIVPTAYGVSQAAYSSAGLAVARNGYIYLGFSFYDRRSDCCFGGSVSGAGIERLTSSGGYVNAWGGFFDRAPDGLAVDGSGFVYAADRLSKQIKKFTRDGSPLTQWELPGGRADLLSDPRGVAVDSSADILYVADSGNNRILVFARQPPVIACPTNILVAADPGQCSALVAFNISATGTPEPSVICTLGSKVITSPYPFPVGTNLVTCTASSIAGVTTCSFTVTVGETHPPVAVATVSPRFALSPNATNCFILAPNNAEATVVLDGSHSSDVDNDPLQFAWSADGQTNVLAAGPVAIHRFAIGPHTVRLLVSDPYDDATARVTFEVITPATAVDQLIQFVNEASLGSRNKRPLLAILFAAKASLHRHHPLVAVMQLRAFHHLVRDGVARHDPVLGAQLIEAAQQVIEALSGGNCHPGGPPHCRVTKLDRRGDGCVALHLAGEPRQIYVVEASTNLVDWEMIGVATERGKGTFEFEDANAAKFPNRFYRTMRP